MHDDVLPAARRTCGTCDEHGLPTIILRRIGVHDAMRISRHNNRLRTGFADRADATNGSTHAARARIGSRKRYRDISRDSERLSAHSV